MKESNFEILSMNKYCPMCNKEHEMKLHFRLVEGCNISGRTVEYAEAYFRCAKHDFEINVLRDLKEVRLDD